MAWESFKDWSESSGLVRFFGEEELATEVASMIEGNELERSAMEFHLR